MCCATHTPMLTFCASMCARKRLVYVILHCVGVGKTCLVMRYLITHLSHPLSSPLIPSHPLSSPLIPQIIREWTLAAFTPSQLQARHRAFASRLISTITISARRPCSYSRSVRLRLGLSLSACLARGSFACSWSVRFVRGVISAPSWRLLLLSLLVACAYAAKGWYTDYE